ncbi:MAG: glucose-1-phosphate thymidylyltransferase, partial [Ruminiclostridium sp.]|nr:glucose-1-phosphate thymidylyltransferase [Ruminiclostridium sp.]
GSNYGISLSYAEQPSPDGLAQACIIGEEFIGDDSCATILGDNVFYGNDFSRVLVQARKDVEESGKATVFGYYVDDPCSFGIVSFDENGKAISIEEKPAHPKSNYAVTGLYFYDNRVVEFAKKVKPSARGELEITDVNRMYLEDGTLNVKTLGRGFAWLDTGTVENLNSCSDFMRMIEERQGLKIGVLEEIAYRNEWITKEQLEAAAQRYGKSSYGRYLTKLTENKIIY